MRVTNDQAKSDAACGLYCPDCDLAIAHDEDWECPHGQTNVGEYAADLLEARVLIKEMREVLVEADTNALGYKCSCDICTKARTLIDKTKEYAE